METTSTTHSRNSSNSSGSTVVGAHKADTEDMNMLWELREELTLKKLSVMRFEFMIEDLEENEVDFDIKPLQRVRQLRETRLSPVRDRILNHPLIKLYDRVNQHESFENLCETDAVEIDVFISLEEEDEKNEGSKIYWTNYVRKYMREIRDEFNWTRFMTTASIAATESQEETRSRQNDQRNDRVRKERKEKKWKDEGGAQDLDVATVRFQEAAKRRAQTDAVEKRKAEMERKRQEGKQLEWVIRERKVTIPFGVTPPPPRKHGKAKATAGRPGLHASSPDEPRNLMPAPDPRAVPESVQRIHRESDSKRARAHCVDRSNSCTPTRRDQSLPPEID